MNAPRKPMVSAIAMVLLSALIGARPARAQAAEGCVPRPVGLVAWWPGDGHTFDVAGTNHARLQNHATYASGEAGQAFLFDGVDDAVNAGPREELVLTNDFTIEAWLFPTGPGTAGAGGIIVNKEGEYEIARYPDGSIQWALANTSPGWTYINTGLTAPLNNWTHWAMSYSNSTVRTYTNGILGHTYSGSGNLGDIDTPRNDFQIGGRQAGGQFFQGMIDEVSIYRRVLDADEIAAIYAAGGAGKCFTNDPVPVVVVHPTDQTGYLLNSVTLMGAAMGVPRPEYQWLFNGALIPNATNATLVLSNLNLADVGSYVLVASNQFGVASSRVASLTVEPGILLREDFEDGTLDPRMSVSTIGGFSDGPGIKNVGTFGSAKAYGFGRSTCWASCFDRFVSRLSIRFAGPTYVSMIRFSEMELYDNWGSGGVIYLDGVLVPGFTFERQPFNDRRPDSIHRTHFIPVGKEVQNIMFQVQDITQSSELFLDDLEIRTSPEIFNNPESFEAGWGDWSSDYDYYWQIRPPGNGPRTARSGQNAACANAGGDYWAGVNSRLISPGFTVPFVSPGELLLLRYWNWHQYGSGDTGLVQIATWNGTDWNPWATIDAPAFGSSPPAWQPVAVDLTAYQGQQVRVAFYHTANSDGSVGAGWYIDEVELSGFIPTPMALDQDVTGTFNSSGDRAYYVLTAPPGGHLLVNLTGPPGSRTEVYVRRGALPSAGAYDYRVVNPGQTNQLFVPDAQAGPWYVMIYADSVPTPGPYTLRTDFYEGIFLTGLTPTRSGNADAVSIDIQGAGFDNTAQVSLVGGVNRAATNVTFVSASRLVTDFDLSGVPTNRYQLTVVQGTNSASLPFVVTEAVGPKLEANLIVPSQVGRNTVASLYIEYANTGDVAMPAPLFVLNGSQNAKLIINPSQVVPDFWTCGQPREANDTLQFLAEGQTPGLLQPGEIVRVPVNYLGLVSGGDPREDWVRFSLSFAAPAGSSGGTPAPLDWDAVKDQMRPPSIPVDAWSALWQNFTAAAGTYWTDYFRMLQENSVYLGRLLGPTANSSASATPFMAVRSAAPGQPQTRFGTTSELLAFEFAQADGLHIVRFLASSTDGFAPTPGLRLSVERVFPNRITGRYQVGAFGRGWSHNWETRLEVSSSCDVTVVGPAGSRRTFKKDSRGGWFNDPGDYARLTALGGGAYSLLEKDGLLRVFGADGRLSYVQDPNGTRITCGYSGNDLTSLTHSPSGQALHLAYSGGRIATITDPVGRTTAFTYSGDHLTSVRYFDGSVVSYGYASGQGITREHALTKIAYPGGTHEYFSYNDQGRLDRMSRDGGAEAVTFSFDNAALVTATDAYGNTTKFYLDHHGLLAKVENPQGSTVRLAYDDRFNLTQITDPAGRTHQYAYDDTGNLLDSTDPLGNHTRFAYAGPFRRLSQLMDAKNNITRYSHDTNGNLTAITYANETVERWAYDAAGNPITWTNRRSNPIQYQFNTRGQLTEKLYPDGSRAAYEYDDSRCNLVAASNYTGRITLAYDAHDRLQRITYPGDRWLEYTYNTAGQRASMTDQLGYRLDYDYDAVGRLRSITNSAGTRIVLYDYDAAGRLECKTLGNGVYTTYAYDRAGQLLTLTNARPDHSVLSFFNYTYDSRGRRTAMATHYGAWTYEYDDLGQLTHAVLASTDAQIPNQDLRYEYDAMGNRVRTVENGVTTEYTVNKMNQYVQVGGIQMNYDADGSLAQKLAAAATVLAITNNFDNRLIACGSTNAQRRFSYDALGFPAEVWRDGIPSYQVHDPAGFGDLVGVFDTSGVLLERQSHGYGIITATDGDGPTCFAFDGIGNASDVTAADASLTETQAFRPFGERIQSANGTLPRFGFGGELGVMQEGDLVYMRARFYDREMGRFTASDPIELFGGDLSLYNYANNDPILLSDPLGWVGFDVKEYVYIPKFGPAFRLERYRYSFWKTFGPEIRDFVIERFTGIPILGPMFKRLLTPYAGWALTRASLWIQFAPTIGNLAYDLRHPNDRGPWLNNNGGPYELPILGPLVQLAQEFGLIPRARDPNDLTGPAGYGSNNFVRADSLLPYTIHFENETNATAPAQRVVVTDRLTNRLDWTTFELTEIAFGDHFIAVPPHTQHFEQTAKLRQNGFDFEVQIEAGIHLDTGEVYARFQSLNPTNGLPPPVDIGLLPPENGTGRGQGHLSYVIRANTNLVTTGTEIRNVASISFDLQPPIATDQKDPHDPSQGTDPDKQALVTMDADPPTSTITPLAAESASPFDVQWSGNDGAGSGIVAFDVQVAEVPSEGALVWTDWLPGAPLTNSVFVGVVGKTYAFRCRATDGVGYVEDWPAIPQAQTTVTSTANRPPVLPAIPDQVVWLGGTLDVSAQATDADVGQTLSYTLPVRPAGMTIANTGRIAWTPDASQLGVWPVEVQVTDNGTPPLSVTSQFTVRVLQLEVGWSLSEAKLKLTFTIREGRQYVVQYTDDLGSGVWQPAVAAIDGTGGVQTASLPIESEVPQRFYRIVEMP